MNYPVETLRYHCGQCGGMPVGIISVASVVMTAYCVACNRETIERLMADPHFAYLPARCSICYQYITKANPSIPGTAGVEVRCLKCGELARIEQPVTNTNTKVIPVCKNTPKNPIKTPQSTDLFNDESTPQPDDFDGNSTDTVDETSLFGSSPTNPPHNHVDKSKPTKKPDWVDPYYREQHPTKQRTRKKKNSRPGSMVTPPPSDTKQGSLL